MYDTITQDASGLSGAYTTTRDFCGDIPAQTIAPTALLFTNLGGYCVEIDGLASRLGVMAWTLGPP